MKKKSAGSVAIMLLVMIYLLIPLVISIIYSVFHKWTGVTPEGFTLHNYVDLFTDSNFSLFQEGFRHWESVWKDIVTMRKSWWNT